MARAIPLAAFVFLLTSAPAKAHEAFTEGGPFINGLLHPIMVPAHVLALAALALWLGRQDDGTLRRAVVAFAIALIAGLVTGPFGTLPTFVPGLLALCLGALAASGWRAPAGLASAIALCVAALIGFDSAEGEIAAALGMWVGAHLILLNIVNIAMRLKANWAIIGTRVIGAWFCAIALMLLALELRT